MAAINPIGSSSTLLTVLATDSRGLQPYLVSFLSFEDRARALRVCRLCAAIMWKDTPSDKAHFRSLMGAVLPSERWVAPQDIYKESRIRQRVHRLIREGRFLRLENDRWVSYGPVNPGSTLRPWEINKYYYFGQARSDWLTYFNQIPGRVSSQIDEFLSEPSKNLIEQRDRCVRVVQLLREICIHRVLAEEQICLTQATEKLGFARRSICKVAQWDPRVDDFTGSDSWTEKIDLLHSKLSHLIWGKRLLWQRPGLLASQGHPYGIELCQSAIHMNGEKEVFSIHAQPDTRMADDPFPPPNAKRFTGKTLFSVYSSAATYPHGRISVCRLWRRQGEESFHISEKRSLKGAKLRYNLTGSILEVTFGQDGIYADSKVQENGDQPALRISVQFIVELFAREKDLAIRITTKENPIPFFMDACDVFYAAGFRTIDPGFNRKLESRIADARELGKIFPEAPLLEFPEPFEFYLGDANRACYDPTLLRDTIVDFGDGFVETWEERIQRAPLLPPGEERVLPTHFFRNLFLYQAPPKNKNP